MKQSRQYYKLIIFADSYFCLKRHLCRNAHFIICLYQNLGFIFYSKRIYRIGIGIGIRIRIGIGIGIVQNFFIIAVMPNKILLCLCLLIDEIIKHSR